MIETVRDLQGFFSPALEAAARRRTPPLEHRVQRHLVDLLADHARGGSVLPGGRADGSLVLALGEALALPPSARADALGRVGDGALLVLGFFPATLDRAGVSATTFVRLGTVAYREAAAVAPDPTTRETFGALGARFEVAADVLGEVAVGASLGAVTRDLVRTLDAWRRDGAHPDLADLIRLGACPGPSGEG